MKTFYIKGKIVEYFEASLIEANTEGEAREIYESELIIGNVKSDSTDLITWGEIELEEI